MSIYDEAIEEAQDFGAFVGLKLEKVIKALERAKKVEKLLELYQEREKSRVTVDGFLKSWELTKQIKALEEEMK